MDIQMHELFRVWVSAILLALSLGWTIFWSILMTRKSAAKAEQDKLAVKLQSLEEAIKSDERLDGAAFQKLETRLGKVEDNIAHLPTKEQLHGLELSMLEMKGDVRELSASLKPLSSSIDRVLNFMDQTKA